MSDKEGQKAEPGVQGSQGDGPAGGGDEMEGLKRSRDLILKEKKDLQRQLESFQKAQAEA
jgi:hypothetical protein